MASAENKSIIYWAVAVGIFLTILVGIFNIYWQALTVYFFGVVISIVIYSTQVSKNNNISMGKKNLFISVIVALGIGLGYFFITRFVPGLSIGLPIVPNSIATQFRFIIVVILAPLVETIFFQGAFFLFLKNFKLTKANLYIAITIQAIIFAGAHLGAYVSGFYNYPTLLSGLISGVSQNSGAFISAFLFAWLAGYMVSLKGIRNLWFAVVLHAVINFISYSLAIAGGFI